MDNIMKVQFLLQMKQTRRRQKEEALADCHFQKGLLGSTKEVVEGNIEMEKADLAEERRRRAQMTKRKTVAAPSPVVDYHEKSRLIQRIFSFVGLRYLFDDIFSKKNK